MRFRDLSGALRIFGGMVVGVFLYANFGPQPEPVYQRVEVPVEVIREVERVDTIVSWKERIVYKTVHAEQVATAPDGARPDVDSFCADAVQQALAGVGASPQPLPEGRNSAPAHPPTPPHLLLRSLRIEDGWFFQKDRLILTGPLSNGDLRQTIHNVRPGVQAHVHGDTVIVQYPRSALLKQLLEAAAFVGAGYVAGRVF